MKKALILSLFFFAVAGILLAIGCTKFDVGSKIRENFGCATLVFAFVGLVFLCYPIMKLQEQLDRDLDQTK